jgi:hypothetical protein
MSDSSNHTKCILAPSPDLLCGPPPDIISIIEVEDEEIQSISDCDPFDPSESIDNIIEINSDTASRSCANQLVSDQTFTDMFPDVQLLEKHEIEFDPFYNYS